MQRRRLLTATLGVLMLCAGCDRGGGVGRPGSSDPPAVSSGQAAGSSGQAAGSVLAGDGCTVSSGADEEPREFDADVVVQGSGVTVGRRVEVSICFVPNTAGRATATLAVVGDDGVVPGRRSVEWPSVVADVRLVTAVPVEVSAGARASLKTTIELFNASGESAGRFVSSLYLLGGPDAVFTSRKSLGELDRMALEHERDSGRVSDADYQRKLAELAGQISLR